MEAAHLFRSLQSLRSIRLKKINGKDLVDDKELLGLFRTVREVVANYQHENQLPELQILLDRLPDPPSLEKKTPLYSGYRFVHRLVMAAITVFTLYFSPLAAIAFLILAVVPDIVIRLLMVSRKARINDALRQIADACSSVEMLIKNNETYKQPC